MSLSNAVISAVLIVMSTTTFAVSSSGHSCFVCTDDGPRRKAELHNLHKLFPGKKLAKCSQYEPSKRDAYVHQCPPGYNGCMTTFAGSSGIRGCSQTAADTCEEVNGLMHCYCTADACNNPSKKLSDPVAMRNRDFRGSQYLDLEDDDADYSSAGGYDDDDEGGSGEDDYTADYSDTTDAPPPFLKVDGGGGEADPPKLTDSHRESVNDLNFEDEQTPPAGGNKESGVAEKEENPPTIVTAGAGPTSSSTSVVALTLSCFFARL